jgi:hypothetical protein
MAKLLLEPKEVDIELQSGTIKKFIISKFPTIAGREIIAKYPLSSVPKLGDYQVNQETMLKLMEFVAVPIEGAEPLRLTTPELIDNHVPDWEALVKIEMQMLEYNCSFFKNGVIQGFIQIFLDKMAPLLSQILTTSVQALSNLEKQPGSNSAII